MRVGAPAIRCRRLSRRLRPTSEKSANGRARQLALHSPEFIEGATHGSLPSRSEKTLCYRAECLIADAPSSADGEDLSLAPAVAKRLWPGMQAQLQ